MKPVRRISEKALLKKLDIPDFRHMTKEKVQIFASSLPYLDRDVALAALAQFPNFVELDRELLSCLTDIVHESFAQNTHSMAAIQESCSKTIEYCQMRLVQPDISQEERIRLENMMMDVICMMSQKDSENKEFIKELVTKVTRTIGGIVLLAGAALGVATMYNPSSIENPDDDDTEQSNDEYRG